MGLLRPADLRLPVRLSRWQWITFVAIVFFAALVRFLWLDRIPPGLWYDEALYALDGYGVSRGHFAWFFAEHGHPREPLFPWLLGGAFALLEPTVLVARGVSAVAGTLAVALFFPVARRFMPEKWALAATAAFAAFRWHIHFSRTIFRAGLASPLALLVVWLFLRWHERRRPVDAVLCGLATGACLYTYISLRVMPLLLLVWIGWMLATRGMALRREWRQVALLFGTAALAVVPLGIDYLRHPDHLFGRTDEISMFEKTVQVKKSGGVVEDVTVPKRPAEALQGIAENALGVAGVWFVRGDYVARHGVPYRPVLDPVTGMLFLWGLGLCTWDLLRRRSLGAVILLSWFVAFAAASVFSFGAPNILRMQGASPVVILLMIAGLRSLTSWRPIDQSAALRRGIPALVLVVFAGLQLNDYFRVYPNDLRVRGAFGADFFYAPAAAADRMAAEVDHVYLPGEFLDSLQVKFLTIRRKNIAGYSPGTALPHADGVSAAADADGVGGSAAWLLTARSIQLADEAGVDQAAQVQRLPGARRVQSFSLPVADDDGRLVGRQPWAELWVRR